MIAAKKPENEKSRLEALVRYDILDTPSEKEYDDIAKLAAYILNMPVSMVSFLDETRKWYKSVLGVDSREMNRDIAVCSHTIVYDQEIMIVEDTRLDERFHDSPITKSKTPTIFYAGVKLVSHDGYVLGTICVVDHKPNKINKDQGELLQALGNQVIRLLEHRRNAVVLNELKKQQNLHFDDLEQFSYALAHDVRSLVGKMVSSTELLEGDMHNDEQSMEVLSIIKQSGQTLAEYLQGTLDYYTSDRFSSQEKKLIHLLPTLRKVVDLINPDPDCEFKMPTINETILVREGALIQILVNLVSNAIKHCDKERAIIQIDFTAKEKSYLFEVRDNGRGIRKEDQETIFNFAQKLDEHQSGRGLGLAIVKKLVAKEGGDISLTSELGVGTTFQFSLQR